MDTASGIASTLVSLFSTASGSLSWTRSFRGHWQLFETSPPSLLFCLPPELLLSVCDFLSWDDVACLSLCNQQLFAMLSKVRNRHMPADAKERLPLVYRLETDLPNHILPPSCLCYRLHKFNPSWDYRPRPDKLPWPPSRGTKSCRPRYHTTDVEGLEPPCFQYLPLCLYHSRLSHKPYHNPQYRLYFSHVQLVMKRFRHGPKSGISPDSLSCTQVRPYPKDLESVGADPQVTSLFSADARVCCNPPVLVLRIQQILFTARQFRLQLSCELGSNWYHAPTRPRPGWYICNHIEYNELAPLVNAHVSSYRAKRRMPLSNFSCDLCETCFCIEFCEYHENDVALIITKWINLGSGLRPDDPRWEALHSQEHCLWSEHYHMAYNWYTYETVRCPRGSLRPASEDDQLDDLEVGNVRTSFENSSTDTFSVLRDRNLSYLKDHQYRKTMSQEAFLQDGTWSVWGGSKI